MSGQIASLVPGEERRVRLLLRNRTPRRLVVFSIRTIVGDAAPGCPERYLEVAERRLERGIPPQSRRRVRLPVELRSSAPDACQDETFPLRYQARARR